MTDEPEDLALISAKKKPRGQGKPFKSGYDKRRWLGGRGVKSPEQREGDEILRAVIWEELSREFSSDMKPLEQPDTVDAMRLMVRGWIKKRPAEVADRIAGKVRQDLDVTSGGQRVELIVKYADNTTNNQSTEATPKAD
jgi:hypothetical protein